MAKFFSKIHENQSYEDVRPPLIELIQNKTSSINPQTSYYTDCNFWIENFEDAPIVNKTRSTDSFINWIESNITKMDVTPSSRTVHDSPHTKSRKHRKTNNRHYLTTKGGRNRRTRTRKNRKNRKTVNKHRK